MLLLLIPTDHVRNNCCVRQQESISKRPLPFPTALAVENEILNLSNRSDIILIPISMLLHEKLLCICNSSGWCNTCSPTSSNTKSAALQHQFYQILLSCPSKGGFLSHVLLWEICSAALPPSDTLLMCKLNQNMKHSMIFLFFFFFFLRTVTDIKTIFQ